MTLTAETITDEDIGALAETLDCADDAQSDLYDLCAAATHAPIRSRRRHEARAHIARELNTRSASKDNR